MQGTRRPPRVLIPLVCTIALAAVLPAFATATHWVPDVDVTVSPTQTKAGRTVNFQITVQNSGTAVLTVCEVEITFGWDPTPRTVFSGSEDIPGGGSKTWMFGEPIPPELSPGSYTRIVTVSGKTLELPPDLVCDANDWTGTIDIVVNTAPVAGFVFAPSNPAANTTVYFHDQSSDPDGSIVSWHWSFGDGEYANGQEEMHQFSSSGSYPVVLTVTDDDGATNVTSQTVVITANVRPVASFSYSPPNARVGSVVQFSDESSDPDGTVVAWLWDFGDDANSSLRDPTHRFTSGGIHSVLLTVTDNQGSNASVSQNLQIIGNLAPVSDFSFSPDTSDTSTEVRFTDQSSDTDGIIVAWRWEFGDGNVSTERNPSHLYGASGEFQVTLNVTDNDGSTGLRTRTVVIRAVPAGDDPGASGFGAFEWGLIAIAAMALAVGLFLIIKQKIRPKRRWGQAGNQNSNGSKSRWRPR